MQEIRRTLHRLFEGAISTQLPNATEEQYDNPVPGVVYQSEGCKFWVEGSDLVCENSGIVQRFTRRMVQRLLLNQSVVVASHSFVYDTSRYPCFVANDLMFCFEPAIVKKILDL